MSLILSVPERLIYARVITVSDSVDKVLKILQEEEAIHPERAGKATEEDIRFVEELRRDVERLEDIVSRMEKMLPSPVLVSLEGEKAITKPVYEEFKEVLKELEQINEKADVMGENIERLNESLSETKKLYDVITALAPKYGERSALELNYDGEIIFTKVVLLDPRSLTIMKERLPEEVVVIDEVPLEERVVAVVAGLSGYRHDFMRVMSEVRAEIVSIPAVEKTLKELAAEFERRIRELETMLKDLKENLNELVTGSVNLLAKAKVIGSIVKDRIRALLNAVRGEYLIAVEGWIPERKIPDLEERLSREAPASAITKLDPKKEPPTLMNNPKPVKPFELITKIYGVPRYNEWDPTPLIAYSFSIFFGLMFGDFIYGLVMFILVTFVLDRSGLVDDPTSPGYLALKKMLIMLSGVSMLVGLLSNTFAGYSIVINDGVPTMILAENANQIPSLLNLADPLFFIVLAIIIGLVHVNIAHILSLVKALKEGNKGNAIAESGLLIAEVFGIPYISHTMLSYDLLPLPDYAYKYLLYGSLAGVGMIIAGRLIGMKGLGMLLWLFDLTGILGDTLSYTRLAGLGLATYFMAKSFNSLAIGAAFGVAGIIGVPIVGLAVGMIIGIIIMFLTNMLNIVFGIIGAFVHSLRLCAVEFLPKFYEGDGREFLPITEKIPKAVVVGSPY